MAKKAYKKKRKSKPNLHAPPKRRSRRKGSRTAVASAPDAKRTRTQRRARKSHASAREKDVERKVTEKTLRDILALRCVQRCTR